MENILKGGMATTSRRDALKFLLAGTASLTIPSFKIVGNYKRMFETVPDSMVFDGQVNDVNNAAGEFFCRVSFDLSHFPDDRTAVARINVPLQMMGEGYPSLRLFSVNAEGSESFVSAVSPNQHPASSFIITDFFNDHAPLKNLHLVIREVPGSGTTIRLTPGQKITLIVSTEAYPRYSLNDMLLPIWTSRRMINETILPVSTFGMPAEGKLLFSPHKNAIVNNFSLDKTYREGVDYELKGNTLRLTPKSSIPFLTEEYLYPETNEGLSESGKSLTGGYVRSVGTDEKLAITYDHQMDWDGPVPSMGSGQLLRTKKRLRSGSSLRITLLGDSISAGASASGRAGMPPYVPGWGELFVQGLRHKYKNNNISFFNVSRGGGNTNWGQRVAPYFVMPDQPDLCIIAFGMNDGNATSTESYLKNIRRIMEIVRQSNPEMEFILVSSMLRNKRWRSLFPMNTYLDALKTIESETIAVSDVWSVSEYLVKTKKPCDISDNINHPHDFMVRVYAQIALHLFNA